MPSLRTIALWSEKVVGSEWLQELLHKFPWLYCRETTSAVWCYNTNIAFPGEGSSTVRAIHNTKTRNKYFQLLCQITITITKYKIQKTKYKIQNTKLIHSNTKATPTSPWIGRVGELVTLRSEKKRPPLQPASSTVGEMPPCQPEYFFYLETFYTFKMTSNITSRINNIPGSKM